MGKFGDFTDIFIRAGDPLFLLIPDLHQILPRENCQPLLGEHPEIFSQAINNLKNHFSDLEYESTQLGDHEMGEGVF